MLETHEYGREFVIDLLVKSTDFLKDKQDSCLTDRHDFNSYITQYFTIMYLLEKKGFIIPKTERQNYFQRRKTKKKKTLQSSKKIENTF